MQQQLYISKQYLLADIVQLDLQLLSVLERYGIQPGFGNTSVEEVCKKQNLNLDFFLILLNTYYNEAFVPNTRILFFKVDNIIDYLRRSHKHYSEVIIPGIQQLLQTLLQNEDAKILSLIESFFVQYKTEILNHFDLEDCCVFPSIMKLKKALDEKTDWQESEALHDFKCKHEPIENKINDLKSILLKYLPANEKVFLRNQVLHNIFQLENDLRKHIRIEECVLIPMVEEMERNVQQIMPRA